MAFAFWAVELRGGGTAAECGGGLGAGHAVAWIGLQARHSGAGILPRGTRRRSGRSLVYSYLALSLFWLFSLNESYEFLEWGAAGKTPNHSSKGGNVPDASRYLDLSHRPALDFKCAHNLPRQRGNFEARTKETEYRLPSFVQKHFPPNSGNVGRSI